MVHVSSLGTLLSLDQLLPDKDGFQRSQASELRHTPDSDGDRTFSQHSALGTISLRRR